MLMTETDRDASKIRIRTKAASFSGRVSCRVVAQATTRIQQFPLPHGIARLFGLHLPIVQ